MIIMFAMAYDSTLEAEKKKLQLLGASFKLKDTKENLNAFRILKYFFHELIQI